MIERNAEIESSAAVRREAKIPTSILIDEHNQAYRKAWALLQGEIEVEGRQTGRDVARRSRQRLEEARSLFVKVLQIRPDNWSAMWGLGKISQRFGEYEDALTWFKKAAEIEWQNPDVAREASICALRLGRGGDALLFAEEAAKLRPQDWGLYANWALALLVNGRTRRAREVAAHAVEGAPQDPVSRRVLALIVNLEASDGPVPKNLDEIEQLIARSG